MTPTSCESQEQRVRALLFQNVKTRFTWKVRPRDTDANRQVVMEYVERMLKERNGTSPKEGDVFIETKEEKPASLKGETS